MTEERHPDDMRSMAEILAEGGSGWGDWKPRPPNPDFKIDYAADATEAWEKEKPRIWEILKGNGVPPKIIADLQADKTEGGDAISAVENFLKTDKLILLLAGDSQVGKSFACAYGLRTRTKTYRTQFGTEEWRTWHKWDDDFAWIEASRLTALAHLRYDADPWEVRLARRIERTKLLVVDEVGGPSFADNSVDLSKLLTKRWGDRLRTMMTTNYTSEELRDKFDKRVLERIRNVGTVVECRKFGIYDQAGLPL